jgi:hypothetical protein
MSKGTNQIAKIDGWVPVFPAGLHTDSKGQTNTWTDADLDQMVANFDANDRFPIVIGHPKDNSPAFGWGNELKREGSMLFSKFADIDPKFRAWGKSGNIANRSIKIVKTPKGYKVGHIGFLGAAAPAIEGMDRIEFSADEGETYEFGIADDGWTLGSVARALRQLRDFFIGEFGQEKADLAMPSWPIEDLERTAAQKQAASDNSFNALPEDTTVSNEKTFTQADIDAAVNAERLKTTAAQQLLKASEFTSRLAANKAFVSSLIADDKGVVRLTPAEAAGWAEALTFCEGMESTEFTFSAADGAEQKPQLFEFIKTKLAGLTPRLKLGKEHVDGDLTINRDDPRAVSAAAQEFMRTEAEAGREINIGQAVDHVLNK